MEVIPVLEELMRLTGLSQRQLGKRIGKGVSQTTVWRWLSGDTEPTKSQWDSITDLYRRQKGWRISIDDMLEGHDDATHEVVRNMVSNYLEKIDRYLQKPPPRRR